MTRAAITTEANEAEAGQTSKILQPPRQLLHPPTHLSQQNNRVSAVGIVCLGTKAGNVSPTVPNTSPSRHLSLRETVKGADACERGDPLSLINSEKQSPVRSRRIHAPKMAHRWRRRIIHHSSNVGTTLTRPFRLATTSCERITHQMLRHQADANPLARKKAVFSSHNR